MNTKIRTPGTNLQKSANLPAASSTAPPFQNQRTMIAHSLPQILSFPFSALAALLFLTSVPRSASAADSPGEIVLRVDAPEGVTMVGGAKIGQLRGKKEEMEKLGDLAKEPVALIGTWSKRTDGESRVEFEPTVPKAGFYDVYVRWISPGFSGGVSKSIPMRVEYGGKTAAYSFGMNTGNVWAFLGTFPLESGKSVKLIADAQGTIGAGNVNAVKLVPSVKPPEKMERILPIGTGEQDEFDKMRIHAAVLFTPNVDANLSDPMIDEAVRNDSANTYLNWKTMQKGEGVTNLWTDLRTRSPIEKNEGGGWELRFSFGRIADMAAAYVGSNAPTGFASKMQGNPELLADILYALEWMYTNRYNERTKNKLGGEWIGMEIIIPINIAKTLLLLHPKVPKEMVEKQLAAIEKISPGPEKFYGSFISTGFNRVFGVYSYALRSILTKNAAALDRVNSLIEEEYQTNNRSVPMVRKGAREKNLLDGYYADGSFIQHAHFPYIGIYGRGLIVVYSELQSLLADSPWEIKDPRAKIFYDWVFRGYAPLFFGGEIMYGSLGRSTGQSWHQNGRVSTEIMDALVRLVPDAPADEKARLSSIIRGWLLDKQAAAYPEFSALFMDKLTPATVGLLKSIQQDETIVPERPQPGTTIFHNTDYVVHHQPEFAVQLRMFSTRIKTHEDINEGTNRFGWYQGEGALFLYNRDNSRYHDHFWATVNPYRLPGITVDPRPRETPGSKDGQLSTSAWAGGVQLDGFGLASMGLAAVEATLTAQKAWFFFGDQIVCLGNEIRSTDGRPIETIVENVKLHGDGDYPFVVNGELQPEELGWSADLKGVKWAHLSGKVPNTDVGWWFPDGAELKALREARTGKWTDSFVKDAESAAVTRNFLTLWYDHGPNPDGATYAYVLLPGRSAEQTKAYAEKPGVEIVENSAKAQSVRSKAMGVTGVNFWSADRHTSAGVTSTGKAAVLVHETDGTLSIGVSDPTQLETKVDITLDKSVSKSIQSDPAMTVVSLNPLQISVDLQKSDGKTFTGEFQK